MVNAPRGLGLDPGWIFILAGVAVLLFGFSADERQRTKAERTRASRLAQAFAAHESRTGKALSLEEARTIEEARLDSEALIGEALELGLDRGDHIVRRRLAQKRRALLLEPLDTREEVSAETDTARTRLHSFRHVFFAESPDTDRRIESAQRALAAGSAWESLGEPFIRGRQFRSQDKEATRRIFGEGFAQALGDAPLETWTPITSSYGTHLVRIAARHSVTQAPNTEQRARQRARRDAQEREVALLKRLRRDFPITREPVPSESP